MSLEKLLARRKYARIVRLAAFKDVVCGAAICAKYHISLIFKLISCKDFFPSADSAGRRPWTRGDGGSFSRWSSLRAIYAPATIMAVLMEIDTDPGRSTRPWERPHRRRLRKYNITQQSWYNNLVLTRWNDLSLHRSLRLATINNVAGRRQL